MGDPIIKVGGLGKKYQIGKQERYYTLRDRLTRIFKFYKDAGPQDNAHIWALKDVSFEVKKGEVIGIIGRNGAGKTTLLKILSRITEPTQGCAELHGRTGSLLEVGTGFHPELTGRENIYLSGIILGMTRREVGNKFDEIVSFAEIERFLDTPVKHYSSGMYVRLAFAVAAHLDPEILFVDEVISVGDIGFQKKCLGKISDVAREGRTVLFVSHNLGAIGQLCSRTILLSEGRVLKDGITQEVLNCYVKIVSEAYMPNGDLTKSHRLPYSDPESSFKWRYIKMFNTQKEETTRIRFHEPFKIILGGYANKRCEGVIIGLGVYSKLTNDWIFTSHQVFNGFSDIVPQGDSEFRVEINPNMLAPGCYGIEVGAVGGGGRVSDFIRVALEFEVLNVGLTPNDLWILPYKAGVIDYPCKWSVKEEKAQ